MRTVVASIIIAFLAATLAVAAPAAKTGADVPACDESWDVALAGKVILRVRTPGDAESCQQRAEIVNARITEMLSGPVRKWEIGVKMKNGEWAVYADQDLIITVDAHSAALNGTSTGTLAHIWAENLRSVIYSALPWGYSPQADEYRRRMERQAQMGRRSGR